MLHLSSSDLNSFPERFKEFDKVLSLNPDLQRDYTYLLNKIYNNSLKEDLIIVQDPFNTFAGRIRAPSEILKQLIDKMKKLQFPHSPTFLHIVNQPTQAGDNIVVISNDGKDEYASLYFKNRLHFEGLMYEIKNNSKS